MLYKMDRDPAEPGMNPASLIYPRAWSQREVRQKPTLKCYTMADWILSRNYNEERRLCTDSNDPDRIYIIFVEIFTDLSLLYRSSEELSFLITDHSLLRTKSSLYIVQSAIYPDHYSIMISAKSRWLSLYRMYRIFDRQYRQTRSAKSSETDLSQLLFFSAQALSLYGQIREYTDRRISCSRPHQTELP